MLNQTNLKNPAFLTSQLVRCQSVTPHEAGVLSLLQQWLEILGFTVERPVFHEKNSDSVENIYARLGKSGKNLMFAGHTDVVPAGDEKLWLHPPFAAITENGKIYGRGAVDMKGGIACFIAALAQNLDDKKHADIILQNSISLLITNDEEGPAINGTVKTLKWANERGEKWDCALVGEPTNPNIIGEMIKIGRRGSLSAILTIHGIQGHVAYPERANNPLNAAMKICEALKNTPLDLGTEYFQPSNLEITSIDSANISTNIIPERCEIRFNIRYNDIFTKETLQQEIKKRIDALALQQQNFTINLQWIISSGSVFRTENKQLITTLSQVIKKNTNKEPKLSTSGGTSDARFIKNYCPVVEFGLVGQTMHKTNEAVELKDLEKLTQIYKDFMMAYLKG